MGRQDLRVRTPPPRHHPVSAPAGRGWGSGLGLRGAGLSCGGGAWLGWAGPGSGGTCRPCLGTECPARPEPEPDRARDPKPSSMAGSPRRAAGRRLQLPLLCLLLQGATAILFAVFVRYDSETDAALWHGGNRSSSDNEFYFRYPSECG